MLAKHPLVLKIPFVFCVITFYVKIKIPATIYPIIAANRISSDIPSSISNVPPSFCTVLTAQFCLVLRKLNLFSFLIAILNFMSYNRAIPDRKRDKRRCIPLISLHVYLIRMQRSVLVSHRAARHTPTLLALAFSLAVVVLRIHALNSRMDVSGLRYGV